MAVAITITMPRYTANGSTRTMPAIVVIGPSSRTVHHCHANIAPVVIKPTALMTNATGIAARWWRSNARDSTTSTAAPPRASTGAMACQSTLGASIDVVAPSTPEPNGASSAAITCRPSRCPRTCHSPRPRGSA